MRRTAAGLLSPFKSWLKDQRGATATIVALLMIPLVALMGFVIDIGHVLYVQHALQTSTDAAALAGANRLNCCTTAQGLVAANAYGGVGTNANAIPGVTVTMASGYPKKVCFTTANLAGAPPCPALSASSPDGPYNGIVVQQKATVPMWFAQAVGMPSINLTANATAETKGGFGQALDVMVVLDTTGSMNSPDSSCSITGASRLTCALTGVRALLSGLNPAIDNVGMMVFPGLTTASQAQYDFDCSASTKPTIASYKSSPVYQVVALGNDYRTSNASTTLSTGSNLVLASQGGGTGCTAGISAVGGQGTYFAGAINAAQSALANDGHNNAQKVIIVLSDGDATADSSLNQISVAQGKNECQAAINAAANAAGLGTWVYSIAYGASTAVSTNPQKTGSCNTDVKGALSACTTMQQIASKPAFFYSDTVGGTSSCTSAANSISELVSVFSNIAQNLQLARLLPNNAVYSSSSSS